MIEEGLEARDLHVLLMGAHLTLQGGHQHGGAGLLGRVFDAVRRGDCLVPPSRVASWLAFWTYRIMAL